MMLDAIRAKEVRARCYESARHVQSLLGPPWDQSTLSENLDPLLEQGFRNYVTSLILDRNSIENNSRDASGVRKAASTKLRRAEELIHFDLPILWLHPVCNCDNRKSILRSALERLGNLEAQITSDAAGYMSDVGSQKLFMEVSESAWREFAEWVLAVVKATESAQASLKQVDAFQACVRAIYHQWCRDHQCDSLNDTQLNEFQEWIDGIVESVAELEQDNTNRCDGDGK